MTSKAAAGAEVDRERRRFDQVVVGVAVQVFLLDLRQDFLVRPAPFLFCKPGLRHAVDHGPRRGIRVAAAGHEPERMMVIVEGESDLFEDG